MRRSYLTAGRKARIDWKALSQRVGHSDVAFTMRHYVETDLDADREVANTLAELIIGGHSRPPWLPRTGAAPTWPPARLRTTTRATRTRPHERHVYRSVYKPHTRGRPPVRGTASALVAGAGFEPATSGL